MSIASQPYALAPTIPWVSVRSRFSNCNASTGPKFDRMINNEVELPGLHYHRIFAIHAGQFYFTVKAGASARATLITMASENSKMHRDGNAIWSGMITRIARSFAIGSMVIPFSSVPTSLDVHSRGRTAETARRSFTSYLVRDENWSRKIIIEWE